MTTLHLWDGYPHTSPDLRLDVKKLQNSLGLTADGYFGLETQAAVLQFQESNDLLVDGIVGNQTWSKLLNKDLTHSHFETTYSGSSVYLLKQKDESYQYRDFIEQAAVISGVSISVIWGIGSRESNWGLLLDNELSGDYIARPTHKPWRNSPLPPDGAGFGRGLMQIDYDAHEFARIGQWKNPKQNIIYASYVLRDCMSAFDTIAPAIASYNCGVRNVQRAISFSRDIDYYTAGRNYSKNVLDRAGWFQSYGWR